MSGRSRLTYAAALHLLAPNDQRLSRLDRVLGGALLAAAPLTAGASLALLDPKTEVIGWLRDLTRTAPSRIQATTGKQRVDWGTLCRESTTTKVVILDGLDELIQATGVTQSGYLERIARFQEAEWTDGNAVVPVVTSRTLVMDRVRIPDGTVLIKLEDLTATQVGQWVAEWNRANREVPSFRPLSPERLLHQGALARQPLLLTLLAVYAAEGGIDDLDAAHLSRAELYRRLLDTFITRQVRDKAEAELGEAEWHRRRQDLRRDLAVAAFGMFNRGRQYVTEEELDRDLAALAPDTGGGERTSLDDPVGRAGRTASAFFFVHVAQSDQHDQARARRTYEFLHATFGEYLIAEHTVTLLREVAQDRERHQGRTFARALDDSTLRALLSHQPLLNRSPIVGFATELAAVPDGEREGLRQTALALLATARDPDSIAGIKDYKPTPVDPVRRLAAYTANLVTLAVLAAPDGVPVAELSDHTDWESTVRLWRAGLDREGQYRVITGLWRDDAGVIAINQPALHHGYLHWVEPGTARLVGDLTTETHLQAGEIGWAGTGPTAEYQRDFHLRLLELVSLSQTVPPGYPSLVQLSQYHKLLELAASTDEPVASTSAIQLLAALTSDGPFLPPDLVTGLLRVVVQSMERHVPVLMLVELVAACPYLLDDPAEFSTLPLPDNPWESLFGALLARRHLGRIPERHRAAWLELIERLEHAIAAREPTDAFVPVGYLTAETVETLAPMSLTGHEVHVLLDVLRHCGPVVWRQIQPGVLAALVRQLPAEPEGDAFVVEVIAGYLAAHGRSEAPDGVADALERLAQLEHEPA